MGWIGLVKEVIYYLDTVGADRDATGDFLIAGAPPVLGIGGDEVVIPDETVYFVGGQRKALAAGMSSTSYGVRVTVL